MKSIIVSAKTVEKAVEEGLQILDTTLDKVDVNVISEGGLLKKAKVEIVLTEDLEAKKQEQQKYLEKLEKHNPKPQVEKTEEIDEEDKELLTKLKEVEKELEQYIAPQEDEKSEKESEVETVKAEIEKFLNGLIYTFGMVAKVQVDFKDREYVTTIIGDNLGVLIGYHGDALEAIQTLTQTVILNKFSKTVRIRLDIENYRAKRAEALKQMAENLANKVKANKKSYKLEPMSSFERKVIHTHLQNISGVATHSEGKEPNRYLVIDYID